MLRNFGGGFSFTSSLPPTDMAAALASVRILRSEEGRKLRHQLQANDIYLFQKLLEIGIPAINYSSHIAAIHVIFVIFVSYWLHGVLKSSAHITYYIRVFCEYYVTSYIRYIII